ncbi:MAG: hypothetical protein LBU64_12535 [Planctomycetota bacterium]|jgi:hypothetical protein|nr:hypothetical protein [Planctomycetota bacterium]
MPGWAEVFDAHLRRLLDGLDGPKFLARHGWVEDYARRAERLLSPENLAALPPGKIYAALESLRIPGCRARAADLGRANTAAEVVAAVRGLLEKPGGFEEKCRAGKIPRAGVVTLSQMLCLARPHRFAIRNAAFTRELARRLPLYTARGLDELGYEEFLDLCRELSRLVEARLKPLGLEPWAVRHRFLLLYALLAGSPSERTSA